MSDTAPSVRTKVKRMPERGAYEQQQLYDILDEGLVAHVALVQDNLPLNIPMGYARQGNRVLLHGSISSRLMKVSDISTLMVFVAHLHKTGNTITPCHQPSIFHVFCPVSQHSGLAWALLCNRDGPENAYGIHHHSTMQSSLVLTCHNILHKCKVVHST